MVKGRIWRAALALALCLALLPAGAGAEARDFSYVKAQEATMEINVDEERGLAFIESRLDVADLAFSHPNELADYYSYTYFDIIANSRQEDERYTLLRLWITYSGPKYQNIRGVSFRIQDGSAVNTYEFSLTDQDATRETLEGGVYEEVLIRFGKNSLPFLAQLERIAKEAGTFTALDEVHISMTLYGEEEAIEVSLPGAFMMDFALVKDAFVEIGGLEDLEKVHETEMTESLAIS